VLPVDPESHFASNAKTHAAAAARCVLDYALMGAVIARTRMRGPGAVLAVALLVALLAIATLGTIRAVGYTAEHPDPERAPVVPADTTLFGFVVGSVEHDGVVYLEVDPAQLLPADESMPAEDATFLLINDSDETILLQLGADGHVPDRGFAYWIEIEAGVVANLTAQDVSEAIDFVPGETP
jgi:hypothetical protein